MFDRGAAAPDTAEDEGFESADEGQSDQQPSKFVRPDSRSNSFSDVSLASEGRSSSPVRPLSRLSRQSLAEHHAATNGHSPAAAQAIPSWSRDMEQYQQQNAAGSLEESIPEMLRIKDLDSGKEYNLDKRYTIRDLNTGQLYVLDGDDGPTSPDDPTSPASGRVTDIIQGRQLSLDEFEQVLGLNAVLEAARQRRRGLSASTGALSEASEGTAASAAATVSGQTDQTSGKPAGKQKSSNWLKHRLFNMSKGSLKNMEDEESDATSRASSAADLQASPDHASRIEAGVAASTSGRMGMPTKVMLHKKGSKQYTNLAVVQELYAHTGVIWCMKFSKNGKYVATAGQDGVIRVWEVITQRGQRAPQNSYNNESGIVFGHDTSSGNHANGVESNGGAGPFRQQPDASTMYEGYSSSCPVLKAQPYRVYQGHKQDVLELCWSKSQFVLSASMDKTVKLWHISMDECLRTFKHSDFVTALDFHPADDKLFLSGSIDGKVRMWNIPDQRVVDWADVHEMVTAVNFSPDGAKAIVGTMKGKCRFYLCANFKLEYETQIDVKNKRSGQKTGKKITGMQFLACDTSKLLITSNDSRIRLYDGEALNLLLLTHGNCWNSNVCL
ncbi:TPA: WD repeat-containing protein 44, variant 2 [Trebouxia sp. C0004]